MPSNLTKLLLILVAIQIVFTMTGVSVLPTTAMYNLLTDSGNWDTSDLIGLINGIILSVGGVLLIAGTILPGKHDLMIFAGLAAAFLSFGKGFQELFLLIQTDAQLIFTATGAGWIAVIFVGPLVAIFFMAVINFWRGLSS